ncbi:hypothetical protein ACQKWADRAFT_75783 [Trichoderma austrokoningii]
MRNRSVPRICKQHLQEMSSSVIVRAAQGSDSSVQGCRSGLEDSERPRQQAPPIHTPDHAGRVSGPRPSALLALLQMLQVVDKARAPLEDKSRGPMAPNWVRSVTRRYTSFENGHGPVLAPGIGRVGGSNAIPF